MSEISLTPELVQQRVNKIQQDLSACIDGCGIKTIEEKWNGWNQSFSELATQAQKKPEVVISLLGSTGCGKSTLINALLGVRVLPIGNVKACTSAVCQVSYQEGDKYSALIEFITREELQNEIDILFDDIKTKSNSQPQRKGFFSLFGGGSVTQEDTTKQDDNILSELSREARYKIKAIYQLPEDAEIVSLDELKEPAEITELIGKGALEFEDSSLKKFKSELSKYLSSNHNFWPIVKTVQISGPFDGLTGGISLVDLPGINDPNVARERVTRNYLKKCRYIWIAYNMGRPLTKDLVEFLHNEDFFRQIILEGRSHSLTVIGTASDNLDIQAARDEFDLDEDISSIDVVLTRNTKAKEVVSEQLREIASTFAERFGDPSKSATIGEVLSQSKIFTVSARTYLDNKNEPDLTGIFRNIEQTEIPALKEHMKKICGEYSLYAHLEAIHKRTDTILHDIWNTLQMHEIGLEQMLQLQEGKQLEVKAAAKAAESFLIQETKIRKTSFSSFLEADYQALDQRLRNGTDRASQQLNNLHQQWQTLHWGTLRATMKRGGVFRGSRLGEQDFPMAIARPILNEITFAWSEFFEEKLGHRLENGMRDLIEASQQYSQTLERSIREIEGLPPELINQINDQHGSLRAILKERVEQSKFQIRQYIQDKQRNLWEVIPERIKNDMIPAFVLAGQETGTGLKQRILDILKQHMNQVSKEMFMECHKMINEGIRGLIQWLTEEYAEMANTLEEHAQMISTNMMSRTENIPVTEVELEKSALRRMQQAVTALRNNIDVQQEEIGSTH